MCNVLTIRRLGYNCTVYLNRQITLQYVLRGRRPPMRKGCHAHIRRKVAVQDDSVMASTGLPQGLEAGGLED